MKTVFKVLSTAVAVGIGLVVLLGYFFDAPPLSAMRTQILQWTVILAAVALLVGLLNILGVHWGKISHQEQGWHNSAVLLVFFLATLIMGILFGPRMQIVSLLFNDVQVPVEASLIALLAISLAVAGFRLLRRRRRFASVVFLVVAVLVLVGTVPWPIGGESALARGMGDLRAWITQVWAVAGARGILLGMALGGIATGLRILLASERPYGE